MIVECMLIWIQDKEKLFSGQCTKQCKQKDFQYICSINEDALESFESLMDAEEYKNIIKDNIILELNDDAPESKLLGIQIVWIQKIKLKLRKI